MSGIRRGMIPAAVAAAIVIVSPHARAEHFRIDLTVESQQAAETAPTDPLDQPDSYRPTPTVDVQHDEPLVFQFVMTCQYPHGVRKNTGVHYWIRRQADHATPQTIDTSPPPQDRDAGAATGAKAAPLNGHLLVNFKPQGMAGLRQKLRLHDPGTYLVRVQSEHSNSDHEHFSQMILQVH